MHTRKEILFHCSDAFIGLPGGLGTFEECMEAARWSQLHLHRKPVALLNTAHYYNPILQQLDHALASGFLSASDRSLLTSGTTPSGAHA
jgi:uncharacterized protein (TIGR00730 family)